MRHETASLTSRGSGFAILAVALLVATPQFSFALGTPETNALAPLDPLAFNEALDAVPPGDPILGLHLGERARLHQILGGADRDGFSPATEPPSAPTAPPSAPAPS
jgi:hypothetical protein